MKLSELTYEYLQSVGMSTAYMNYDCEDALRQVSSAETLDLVKQELSAKYGDVDLIINPKAAWFDQIKIDDEKWQADHESFCKKKAAWCAQYGCD